MLNKVRKNKMGITLIVLVITIVVLLILSGIAINLTFRRKWYIFKSQKCKRRKFNKCL